jgi:LIM domain-binding protein 1
VQVYTEGRLIVEFSFDDMMRIRSWHFAIRNHRELVPRSVIAMQVRPYNKILCSERGLSLLI